MKGNGNRGTARSRGRRKGATFSTRHTCVHLNDIRVEIDRVVCFSYIKGLEISQRSCTGLPSLVMRFVGLRQRRRVADRVGSGGVGRSVDVYLLMC